MSETIHPRKARALRLGVYEAQKPGAVVASDMQREPKPPVEKKKSKAKPKKAAKPKADKKPEAPKTAEKPKADDKPAEK